MSNHTFSKLILRDDVYVDAVEVTDEKGYAVIEIPNTAIMIQWRDKLGIDHWSQDERAYINLSLEQQKANARRIVACVNLLSPFTTEQIENGIDLVALLQQRDELLAALKLALASHGKLLVSDPPQDAWKYNRVDEIGRTAIAKVEGGAA